ncbi:MAG TPA: DUF1552 domain-containing protein, partial [Gemmataceae bacterium]|nr:DUF1552 domain-containing protein [Gemmataceae bacterium]
MTPLSRRALLKGLGASLALPVLDAMLPRAAWSAPATLVKNRMAFVFVPIGAIMEHWTPARDGADYELSKTLLPLRDVQQDILVLSNFVHDKARPHGDGGGDHDRDPATFLTGAHARKSQTDIHIGQSVDQYAAERIGGQTRLPSLELAIEPGGQAKKCEYSCAYSGHISWKTPSVPMAKEIKPRAVFERMFGGKNSPAAQARRAATRQSILDFVADDTRRLNARLGPSDRQKLDQYLSSVREVEQRIEREAATQVRAVPDLQVPDGIPRTWAEHMRLMYDLMLLAFQTDTTRICTFMLANGGSFRTLEEIGIADAYHRLSHHGKDPEKLEKLQKIDQYMVEQFAYFLKRMRNVPEADGTLLDHSMILYGSALSDPDRHNHENLPIVLAGRGGGTIKTGRHVKYSNAFRTKKEVSLSNLLL